jgi:hypothetical protein
MYTNIWAIPLRKYFPENGSTQRLEKFTDWVLVFAINAISRIWTLWNPQMAAIR